MNSDFENVDFFMDLSQVDDPHPYFNFLRNKGPAVYLPEHNVIALTDYDEAVKVWLDTDNYSACNSVIGPIPPLPFEPEGNDITAQIEANRHKIPFGEELLTLDQPHHTPLRSLIMRLFTPKRLREIEDYIKNLADRLIDKIAAKGSCEMFGDYGETFSALVIADLLGIPQKDRELFYKDPEKSPAQVGATETKELYNPLELRREMFLRYIEERRRNPQADILSELANAKYPDGSIPAPIDVVRVASLLFGAGQDTTAHLLTASMRILAENPQLQSQLRGDRQQIPAFVEEVLRFEGPVKAIFRVARKPTSLCGVEIKPGTTAMLITAALNRDPAHFDNPQEFKPGRKAGNQHLSFGRGIHMCPGAQLARTEARISLERILTRLNTISINEDTHGPANARRFDYAPTYIFRALKELHLTFDPAE